jgi:hypothetical protein
MSRMVLVLAILATCILFTFFPYSSFSEECDPCDISLGYCGSGDPPYNEVSVHDCPAIYTCFKFFRRTCGTSTWTLIYEGTNHVFCDTAYGPEDCVQYKCQMWEDAISSTSCYGGMYCETPASHCDSGCQ